MQSLVYFNIGVKKMKKHKPKVYTHRTRVLALLLALTVIAGTAGGYRYYVYKTENNVEALSQVGSRGEEVRQIQTKLRNLGYFSGQIDGIYGTITRDAVKKFQEAKGLSVDGIAGPQTLSALGISSSGGSGQYSSSDVYLLAKVIAAEARGEPYVGQVAVGAVILNRIQHASFPDSMAGVVYQPGAFSCVYDSNWSTEPNASSKKAAQDAINGWDPCGGAIYYYNPAKTSNKWMRTRPVITTIGAHVFCS